MKLEVRTNAFIAIMFSKTCSCATLLLESDYLLVSMVHNDFSTTTDKGYFTVINTHLLWTCVHARVCARVRACVRACVCVCGVCVYVHVCMCEKPL